jgi:hypothetical protein
VLRRIEKDYASSAPAKEGFAAILAGDVRGRGGLAADVAAGGLTSAAG